MGEAAIFGLGAVNTGLGAYSENQALRGQSDYERRMTNVNTGWAQLRADDALRQGDFQAGQARRYGEKVKGAQRVAAAAGNVDVNSGSAAQIQAETDAMSQLDVLAARNNAFKEMMGIKADDSAARGQSKMNRLARKSAGKQSIIQAGGSIARQGAIAGYRHERKQSGKPPSYARQYDAYEDE